MQEANLERERVWRSNMPRNRAMRRRLLRQQHGCSMFGNVCFLAGSLLFLSEELQTFGVLLFVAGSFGLLLGGILPALVRLAEKIRGGSEARRSLGLGRIYPRRSSGGARAGAPERGVSRRVGQVPAAHSSAPRRWSSRRRLP